MTPELSRTRTDRTGDKRSRIVDAAIKVFAEKGFFTARVSEIAREAGVADGTIYLYFENKDDLLIQVFEESMVRVVESLTVALRGAVGPEDKLRRFVEHHLALVEDNRELAEVLTVELRQSAKFMKEHKNPRFAEYLRIAAEIYEEGIERGVFRPDITPWLQARALFGMLDELALTWVLGRAFDIRRAADEVHGVLMNGLRLRAPGQAPVVAAATQQGGTGEDSGDGETGHRP
ncbi:MAG: hypothetical protein AMXMBFR64_59620 [Myxococcales bacterium]